MEQTGKRILIIDDDPDIGVMLKMMLEFKGYATIVSERAEKVMSLIYKDEIDLVILDMLLSGTNGAELCTRLKKDITTTDIPIIMISAHPNAKELCLDAGADCFVAKPFDMYHILDKINSLLAIQKSV